MFSDICKKYTFYFLAAIAVSIGLNFLFESFTGNDLPSGVSLTITTIIPAVWAGYTWFKETNTVPEPHVSWALAWRFTGIQIAFSAIFIVIFLVAVPEIGAAVSPALLGLLLFAFLFATLMVLLLNRFFFPFGARQAARAQLT